MDPAEAKVVQQVFRWYAQDGLSMYAITTRLNDAGILSAGYNGKPGSLWSRTTVWQMLKSATYLGEHRCSGLTIPIPAIIDHATFEAVQRKLKENRQRLVGRPSNQYLLRGYLWCAKCGRRCVTYPNNGYPNYRCGHIEYKPYRRLCHAPQIRTATLE